MTIYYPLTAGGISLCMCRGLRPAHRLWLYICTAVDVPITHYATAQRPHLSASPATASKCAKLLWLLCGIDQCVYVVVCRDTVHTHTHTHTHTYRYIHAWMCLYTGFNPPCLYTPIMVTLTPSSLCTLVLSTQLCIIYHVISPCFIQAELINSSDVCP